MGFTQYWKFSRNVDLGRFAKAILECGEIIRHVQEKEHILANWEGTKGTEPEIAPNIVKFNGIEDDSCETFVLCLNETSKFSFCKTRRRPYDKVVVACLVVLANNLENQVDVSSDGDKED